MADIFRGYYRCPAGLIVLEADEKHLLKAGFCDNGESISSERKNRIINAAVSQLDQYFKGERTKFDLKIALQGSNFKKSVLQECSRIPYGHTISYSCLAQRANRPESARAVGQILKRNPYVIIIPCHRVIGKNGNLTGFSCGLWRKEYLIGMERKQSISEP